MPGTLLTRRAHAPAAIVAGHGSAGLRGQSGDGAKPRNAPDAWHLCRCQVRTYRLSLVSPADAAMHLTGANAVPSAISCQGLDSQNFFEDDPSVDYFRFPIATWAISGAKMDTREGVLAYFQPLWDWIDEKMEEQRSVLIHCLAGAHRAGTTGTAFLMYKENLPLEVAISTAKTLRPIINPFGRLTTLLDRYGKALAATRADEGEEGA
eukprot:scaffold964_cov261-Pinguiococcus_pyrenoidosus.AAC.9